MLGELVDVGKESWVGHSIRRTGKDESASDGFESTAGKDRAFVVWLGRLFEAETAMHDRLLESAELAVPGMRGELERALERDRREPTDYLLCQPPGDSLPLGRLCPRFFGPYRLLSPAPAAVGGMAEVYRVRHRERRTSGTLALKVLRSLDPHRVDRFERERRILQGLDHPNIPSLIAAGASEEGFRFLVMDYVDGVPVDEYCAGRSIDAKIELVLELCTALGWCHDRGVIHRDLKPSNILVRSDGTPMLLDFGISKCGDEPSVTCTAQRMVSRGYASPEALTGALATPSTDVFGLGVLLFELLNGNLPFANGSFGEWRDAVQRQRPRRLTLGLEDRPELARQLRGDLEWIVHKALRRQPRRRYRTVAELALDLQRYLRGEPVRRWPGIQRMLSRSGRVFAFAARLSFKLVELR